VRRETYRLRVEKGRQKQNKVNMEAQKWLLYQRATVTGM